MWFDPYKLLASANFQDELGADAALGGSAIGSAAANVPIDPALSETPPADALSQANAPYGPVNLFPSMTQQAPFELGGLGNIPPSAGADPFGAGAAATPDPGTGGGAATPGAPPTDPTSTISTGPAAFQGTGGKVAPGQTPGSGPDTPTPLRADNVSGRTDIGQGAGGAAGANAMTQLATALQGVARAAQQGNPQAMQLMNMLRQMQMMQGMGGMMGGMGGQYNPYMNQFNNPWAARHRMEQMRREFMERQRARAQIYGHTPGGGTFGGGRGRGR